jgi:hypothetical protein
MNALKHNEDDHEKFVDAFKVMRKDHAVIGRSGNFVVLYLKEPMIKISEQYRSTMFPKDFSEILEFYTSGSKVHSILKFFYVEGDKLTKQLLNHLKLLTSQRLRQLNFHLDIELNQLRSYDEVYEKILVTLQGLGIEGNRREVIVGGSLGSITESSYNNLFERAKAYSIINRVPTHLININRVNSIVRDCKKGLGFDDLLRCKAYKAYVLNNIVQLYAKSGGIPWIPAEKLLARKVIIGLATAKMKTSDQEKYIIGVAFSIAYFGKEIRSFVVANLYNLDVLDKSVLKTKGIYIPRETAKELISTIAMISNQKIPDVDQYIIFQSPIIHDEEVEGLREALGGDRKWVLVHVKDSGFSKRIYDVSTSDWGPYRGVCVLDKDYLDTFKDKGFIKALLVSTGRVKMKKLKGTVEEALYRATPKPLELEICADVEGIKDNKDPLQLVVYISRAILLLSKLDWEAYTNWPKVPFVIKYAQRLARIIARADEDTRKKLLNTLTSSAELRLVM